MRTCSPAVIRPCNTPMQVTVYVQVERCMLVYTVHRDAVVQQQPQALALRRCTTHLWYVDRFAFAATQTV